MVEQQQQYWQQEVDVECQDELYYQVEVVFCFWQCFEFEFVVCIFEVQELVECGGYYDEIGECCIVGEQYWCGDQEWQECFFFFGVKVRGDEGLELVGDYWKVDEEGGEQCDF